MNTISSISVIHIITGLNVGGAEMMLFKLLEAIDRERYPSMVISLTDIGLIGKRMQDVGIPVIAINMQAGSLSFRGVQQLVNVLKNARPQVVQTWMYHADLLGGWAACMASVKKIAWNIRNSTLDWKRSKFSTQVTVKLCAVLSHKLPNRIIACSKAAADVHRRIGYAGDKFQLIPNGFDLTKFKPDQESGLNLRLKLGIPITDSVVGMAARFDDQKDHQTFISAAEIVMAKKPGTRFLLCGEGVTSANERLTQWIGATGNPDNFYLFGRWDDDMSIFHNVCDVSVSSSAYGESFSNVLGEAMACGVPCVSTRVGGAEEVIGDTGVLVPVKDPKGLAEGIIETLEQPNAQKERIKLACRQRVMENFDIKKIARLYTELWEEMIALQ